MSKKKSFLDKITKSGENSGYNRVNTTKSVNNKRTNNSEESHALLLDRDSISILNNMSQNSNNNNNATLDTHSTSSVNDHESQNESKNDDIIQKDESLQSVISSSNQLPISMPPRASTVGAIGIPVGVNVVPKLELLSNQQSKSIPDDGMFWNILKYIVIYITGKHLYTQEMI